MDERHTGLRWVSGRWFDPRTVLVAYRRQGDTKLWAIFLDVEDIAAQYEPPSSAEHLAVLLLEEIDEPSPAWLVDVAPTHLEGGDASTAVWRGLDQDTIRSTNAKPL